MPCLRRGFLSQPIVPNPGASRNKFWYDNYNKAEHYPDHAGFVQLVQFTGVESAMSSPLASFPIVETRSTEVAEQVLSRELAELRFKSVRSCRSFHLEMNGVRLGRTLVGYNRFATDMVVDPGQTDGMFSLAIGAGGSPSVFHFDGEPVVCAEHGAMSSPTRRLLIHRPAGSGACMIRVKSDAIQERLVEVLDRCPRKAIVFKHRVDLARGVGGQARRFLAYLVETFQNDPSVVEQPLLRTGFDEMLVNILLALPSNLSDELIGAGQFSVAPGMVRRAEQFMEAHATEPITISDVVTHCNCSRSALFSAFRKYRGYTPLQFLGECRLRSAREALQAPSSSDTVTSIAYGCGFSHLGRFSEAYRQRFGEAPSQTLRKAGLASE
jgi:AraC-like DNA-binding protein